MCVSGERASYTSVKGFSPLSLSGKGTNCGFLISNQSTSSILSLCVLPHYLKKKKKERKKETRDNAMDIS